MGAAITAAAAAKHEALAARIATGKKFCSRCARELPAEDFGPQRSAPDGLRGWCRPCSQQYGRDRRSRLRDERMAASAADVADLDRLSRAAVYQPGRAGPELPCCGGGLDRDGAHLAHEKSCPARSGGPVSVDPCQQRAADTDRDRWLKMIQSRDAEIGRLLGAISEARQVLRRMRRTDGQAEVLQILAAATGADPEHVRSGAGRSRTGARSGGGPGPGVTS
jgi:hypothetical protein